MATTLSRDDVIKLANLARIDIDEADIDSYIAELSAILDYVQQLADVDIDGLEPTNQVTGLKNVWREDEEIDYGYKSVELLKNLPSQTAGYIKVKRMIE